MPLPSPISLRAICGLALAIGSTQAFASQHWVSLETIPSGAQVEVNGNVTCKTPCSIRVPDYYFGKKRTAFSSHGVEPIRARFTKEGYVPKTIDLTIGPIHWTNLYGNHVYDYYLMRSDGFRIQLDPVQAFVPSSILPSPPSTATAASSPQTPGEEIVRQALPAVVSVSTPKASGSGFFITSDGVVVTNAHVVQDAASVTVLMPSGRELESTHLYVDDQRDLALIKVPISGNPFLKLSATLPAPGSDVIAIGTPGAHDVTGTLMLPNTVTKGVVSGIREFPEGTTESVPGRAGLWIQTDATINHGNSGGPLLNSSGEVVGINTLAFAATGTPGLNFALAATELTKMMESRFGVQPPSTSATANTAASAVQASTATGEITSSATATVSFLSNPPGADIEVDGVFLGSAPAELPLQLGQRRVKIWKKGFKPYERTIQVLSGGVQRITVDLEAQ